VVYLYVCGVSTLQAWDSEVAASSLDLYRSLVTNRLYKLGEWVGGWCR
jgi:hypothetical protein